jgi:hypothetical protein
VELLPLLTCYPVAEADERNGLLSYHLYEG